MERILLPSWARSAPVVRMAEVLYKSLLEEYSDYTFPAAVAMYSNDINSCSEMSDSVDGDEEYSSSSSSSSSSRNSCQKKEVSVGDVRQASRGVCVPDGGSNSSIPRRSSVPPRRPPSKGCPCGEEGSHISQDNSPSCALCSTGRGTRTGGTQVADLSALVRENEKMAEPCEASSPLETTVRAQPTLCTTFALAADGCEKNQKKGKTGNFGTRISKKRQQKNKEGATQQKSKKRDMSSCVSSNNDSMTTTAVTTVDNSSVTRLSVASPLLATGGAAVAVWSSCNSVPHSGLRRSRTSHPLHTGRVAGLTSSHTHANHAHDTNNTASSPIHNLKSRHDRSFAIARVGAMLHPALHSSTFFATSANNGIRSSASRSADAHGTMATHAHHANPANSTPGIPMSGSCLSTPLCIEGVEGAATAAASARFGSVQLKDNNNNALHASPPSCTGAVLPSSVTVPCTHANLLTLNDRCGTALGEEASMPLRACTRDDVGELLCFSALSHPSCMMHPHNNSNTVNVRATANLGLPLDGRGVCHQIQYNNNNNNLRNRAYHHKCENNVHLYGDGNEQEILLCHARVRQILHLAGWQRAGVSCDTWHTIRQPQAIALLAWVALARWCVTLPRHRTCAFYADFAARYVGLLRQLPRMRFGAGVDVSSWVAALVACGLRLTECSLGNTDANHHHHINNNVPTSRDVDGVGHEGCGVKEMGRIDPDSRTCPLPQTDAGATHKPHGVDTRAAAPAAVHGNGAAVRKRVVPSILESEALHAALLGCLGEHLEDCAHSAVTRGVVAGLSWGWQDDPPRWFDDGTCTGAANNDDDDPVQPDACFSAARHPSRCDTGGIGTPPRCPNLPRRLVTRLHDLLDAYAHSSHRAELPYQRFLMTILEALGRGVDRIDVARTHRWVTVILSRDYMIAALCQRESLHARIVAASLDLLTREMAGPAGAPPRQTWRTVERVVGRTWHTLHEALTHLSRNRRVPPDRHRTPPRPLPHEDDGIADAAGGGVVRLTFYSGHVRVVASAVMRAEWALTRRRMHMCHHHHHRRAACDDHDATGYRCRVLDRVLRFLLLPASVWTMLTTDTPPPLSPAAACRTDDEAVPWRRFDHRRRRGARAAAHALLRQACRLLSATAASASTLRMTAVVQSHLHTLLTHIMTRTAAAAATANAEHHPICDAKDDTDDDAARRTTAAVASTAVWALCARHRGLTRWAVTELSDAVARAAAAADSDAAALRRLLGLLGRLVWVLNRCEDADLSLPGAPTHHTVASASASARAVRRFGQLLRGLYEDAVRVWWTGAAAAAAATTPVAPLSPPMRIIAREYGRLVRGVHRTLHRAAVTAARLLSAPPCRRRRRRRGRVSPFSSVGAPDAADAAAAAVAHRCASLRRRLAATHDTVAALTRQLMKCMIHMAWPGSGILYACAGGQRHGGHVVPVCAAAMSRVGMRCVGPLLDALRVLMHLGTLFPVRRLRRFAAHANYAAHLLHPARAERFIAHYVHPPHGSGDDPLPDDTVGPAEAEAEAAEGEAAAAACGAVASRASLFTPWWLLFNYYGYAMEALRQGTTWCAAATPPPVWRRRESACLTARQAELIRLLVASAPPLMRMRSSEMHRAMSDIAVMLRYRLADAAAETGEEAMRGRLRGLFGGARRHWYLLSRRELFLLQAIGTLELLRAAAGAIANVALYHHFAVREYVAGGTIQQLLGHVAAAACALYTATLRRVAPAVRYRRLAADGVHLVMLASFSIASVRLVARALLRAVVHAFPSVATYTASLPLLWMVCNVLEVGSAAEVEAFCASGGRARAATTQRRRPHQEEDEKEENGGGGGGGGGGGAARHGTTFDVGGGGHGIIDSPAVSYDVHSRERRRQWGEAVRMARWWEGQARAGGAALALFDTAARFLVKQQMTGRVHEVGGLSGSRLAVWAAQPSRAEATMATTRPEETEAEAEARGRGVSVVGEVVVPNYAQTLIQYSNAYGQLISAINYAADWSAVEGQTVGRLSRALQPRRTAVARVLRRARLADVLPAAAAETKTKTTKTKSTTTTTTTTTTTPSSSSSSSRGHRPPPPPRPTDAADEELAGDYLAAVAVLSTRLTRPVITARLLHLLVHRAVQSCSSRCITGAVFAWRRLLANERASFTVPLLRHLRDALAWTRRHGFGLFDGARPAPAEAVQTGPHASPNGAAAAVETLYGPDYASNSPHTILFAFVADAYVDGGVPTAHAAVVHGLLYDVAMLVVRDARRLSLKDTSFAETMRAVVLLLHIAARLDEDEDEEDAAAEEKKEEEEEAAASEAAVTGGRWRAPLGDSGGRPTRLPRRLVGRLRGCIYAALLQWFEKSPPSWYYAADPAVALAEMPVLTELVRLLEREEARVWEEGGRGTTAVRRCRRACLLGLLRVCVRHEHTRLRVLLNPRRGVVAGTTTASLVAAADAPACAAAAARRCAACGGEKHVAHGTGSGVVYDVYDGVGARLRRRHRYRLRRRDARWVVLLTTAAQHRAAVVTALVARFGAVAAVRRVAAALIHAAPTHFAHLPAAVDVYLSAATLTAQAPALGLFVRGAMVQALRLLDARYRRCPAVMAYATRSLMARPSAALVFYMPQLLQLLAHDDDDDGGGGGGCIAGFLARMSARSVTFTHQLLWALRSEAGGGEADGGTATAAQRRCAAVARRIVAGLTFHQEQRRRDEFDYMDRVTRLSGSLMAEAKSARKAVLRRRLREDAFFDTFARHHMVYLPTDARYRVWGVVPQSAGAMQSAAKCPILVQFRCRMCAANADEGSVSDSGDVCGRDDGDGAADRSCEREGGDGGGASSLSATTTTTASSSSSSSSAPVVLKSCIFKMGDDCRQDQLSLQLIGFMQRILSAVGVPFYLYPYQVIATDKDCGIIECVPHAKSRNEIGLLVESNVAEYFVQTFGHPESVRFHRARVNFIRSVASYSVVSYILNIKDRHNGNIMIDAEGHVVHIDFGFLFDTSPGGNINFESSPFKLTTEMIQLIGRDVGAKSSLASPALARALVDEESYVYFKVIVNRCFLAVRQYGREICILVELMLRSGLPCFKPRRTIADLARRLAMDSSEAEAAAWMRRRIYESRENLRTVLYDQYQRIVEGIQM